MQSTSMMIGPILAHTPLWVWGLLAGLVVLGLTQVRHRQASAGRVATLPLAMTALSLWSTVSAFGASPQFALLAALWLMAAAAMFGALLSTAPPAGTCYDAATRTFALPGSWTPLVLILSLFVLRYTINVALALQPALAGQAAFTAGTAAAYGAFSGIFGGRAARLWRLARRPGASFTSGLPA